MLQLLLLTILASAERTGLVIYSTMKYLIKNTIKTLAFTTN